jgi:hypothetical protein
LEMPSIPETLNGASVSNVLKTVSDSATDLIVISLTYILSVEMQPVTLKFSCVSFIVC